MTLRHSRDPSIASRRSSQVATSRSIQIPPPPATNTIPPSYGTPTPPRKRTTRRKRWVCNKNTILRLPTFPPPSHKRAASHEARSHRLGGPTRQHGPLGDIKSVQGNNLPGGSHPIRDESGHAGVRPQPRLKSQSDSWARLARTSMGTDELQLQLRRDGAEQHGWKQRWRQRLQHRRLFWRRRMPSRRRTTSDTRRVHSRHIQRPNLLRHLPRRRLQHPDRHRFTVPGEREQIPNGHPAQPNQPYLHRHRCAAGSERRHLRREPRHQ